MFRELSPETLRLLDVLEASPEALGDPDLLRFREYMEGTLLGEPNLRITYRFVSDSEFLRLTYRILLTQIEADRTARRA